VETTLTDAWKEDLLLLTRRRGDAPCVIEKTAAAAAFFFPSFLLSFVALLPVLFYSFISFPSSCSLLRGAGEKNKFSIKGRK
jgi:hypothetical protein